MRGNVSGKVLGHCPCFLLCGNRQKMLLCDIKRRQWQIAKGEQEVRLDVDTGN